MAFTQLVGSRVRRVEDPRFLVGKATYVDDIRLPDTLHLAFVRSTRAHARLGRIDLDAARQAFGVHGIFTGADIAAALKPIGKPYHEKVFPPSVCHQPKWPCLAIDKVRYVGEGVVAILAESRYLAEDAAELVDIEYEELPVVTDAEEALKPGAPLIHEEFDSNMMVHVTGGGGDVEAAFRDAAVVVRERFHTNRHMGCALEGRATLAKFDADGDITLWSSNQMPHMLRTRVADIMGFPEHKLRVIAPDVGGGFGPKAFVYPEDVLTCYFAKLMKRPVRWTEDRREHLLATFHAKEDIVECEMSFTADGTVRGMRAKIVQDLGAYCADPWPSPFEGLQLAATLEGPYKFQGYAYEVSTAWTNKMTSAAYRGVGHVPGVYVQEHMMDLAARRLGMDPIALRLKNMIRPEEFPYVTLTGLNYDSGSSTEALKKAADILDYKGFRSEQLQARAQGRYIGVGISTYIEMTVFGTKFMAAAGVDHGNHDSAIVRMDPGGGVTLLVGTLSHGQGHQTTFAQLAADELGVRIEDIKLVQGDTQSTPYGWGTGASRSAVVGGGAVVQAARKVKEKILRIAGKMLEVSPADLELVSGKVQVKGAPTRAVAIKDVARMATFSPGRLPAGEEPGLEATYYYDPPAFTFANATHITTVEVDIETGKVKILRYVVVEDCGRIINPVIVEGQITGGVAQGLGTVLYEHLIYDENGQMLTGSFMDYLLPTSTEVPNIEFGHIETLTPLTVGGVKGMGEGGAIAPPGAIANAVADALAPFDVKFTELPLTPNRVWDTIRKARQKQSNPDAPSVSASAT